MIEREETNVWTLVIRTMEKWFTEVLKDKLKHNEIFKDLFIYPFQWGSAQHEWLGAVIPQ